MATPNYEAVLWCTDEDILTRTPSDFSTLAPRHQRLAYATDGVFNPGQPWVLNSASTDFVAQGVGFGHVVQLIKPDTVIGGFTSAGDKAIVDSVTTNAATLRRPDVLAGIGQPPAPAAGLSGVMFLIATLGPQIEDATYDINSRYNIDPNIMNRGPDALYDQRQLRQATVLTVLWKLYLAMSRASGSNADDFAAKSNSYKEELERILDRLELRWGVATAGIMQETEAPSTKFGMRIVR